jgi:hypothetical protein
MRSDPGPPGRKLPMPWAAMSRKHGRSTRAWVDGQHGLFLHYGRGDFDDTKFAVAMAQRS